MFFSADDERTETSALLPGCVHKTNNAHFNRINDYGTTLYDEQLTELMYPIVNL